MITQGTVVVGTVATLIHRSTSNGCSVHIYSANGGQDVTLGNGSVVAGNGYVMPSSKTSEVTFVIPPGDSLFGITATNTHPIYVLRIEY